MFMEFVDSFGQKLLEETKLFIVSPSEKRSKAHWTSCHLLKLSGKD